MRTKPRPINVRGHAEIVEAGGTRVRFFCPHGHTQVEDLGRKSLPFPKRMSAGAVRLLARAWSKGHAGVTFTCKTCTKEHHAVTVRAPDDLDLFTRGPGG